MQHGFLLHVRIIKAQLCASRQTLPEAIHRRRIDRRRRVPMLGQLHRVLSDLEQHFLQLHRVLVFSGSRKDRQTIRRRPERRMSDVAQPFLEHGERGGIGPIPIGPIVRWKGDLT